MANDCPSYYCGDDWDELPSALCAETFTAGINKMVMLRCGVEPEDIISDSDPSAIDLTKVQALINGNDARVIPFVQVTIGEPSALTTDVLDPCSPDKPVNYDRTIVVSDPNVTRERVQFWNSVDSTGKFKNGGVILFECDGERATYIEHTVSFGGGRNSPEKSSDIQRITKTGTWRSKDDPLPYSLTGELAA